MSKSILRETLNRVLTKQPTFSVIIPTYKDENYVKECLESLLKQGLSKNDLEVIITNDASGDGTVREIYNFMQANKDWNFRFIINETNLGVSESRNKAINIATGKFLVPLDGDDYLEPNSLKDIKQLIKNTGADLIIPRMDKFYEPDVIDRPEKEPIVTVDARKANKLRGQDFFLYLKENRARLCMPIISKKIVDANNFRFENTLCEDDKWSLNLYMASKTPKYYDKPHYHYRKRNNSRSRTNFKGIVEKKYELCLDVLKMKKKNPKFSKLLISYSKDYYNYATAFKQDKMQEFWDKVYVDIEFNKKTNLLRNLLLGIEDTRINQKPIFSFNNCIDELWQYSGEEVQYATV